MKRIVILISGRGSNLRSIAEACRTQDWQARIAAVISNRPDAAGLAYAAERGIATAVVDHRGFGQREAFDAALAQAIDAHAPDIVALAGFMRILGPAFIQRYAGRIVNIHPSLLPAFPGLRVQQQALDAGVRVSGCTVHLVTTELDTHAWIEYGNRLVTGLVSILAPQDTALIGLVSTIAPVIAVPICGILATQRISA